MTQVWYPSAIRTDLSSATGSYVGGYAHRGLLHITAGSSYAGALSVYRSRGYWPHFTATFERHYFQIYQHLPIDQFAKALKNAPGGVETNRASCVQIEIVWPSITTVGQMAKPYLDGIAAWMRWVETNFGVHRSTGVSWTNPARMSAAQWTGYSGWCGHMHVPENDHDDPGPIDISYLLTEHGQGGWKNMRYVQIDGDPGGHVFVVLEHGLAHISAADYAAIGSPPVEKLPRTDPVFSKPRIIWYG